MDVFISYKSEEMSKATEARKFLEQYGISVWMAPESISGTANYTQEIPYAIESCKAFLLILSEKAQKSRWVSAELENAFKNNKIIIPLMIEKCSVTKEFDFMISQSSWIKAYEDKRKALLEVVCRVKKILGVLNGEDNMPVPKIFLGETEHNSYAKNVVSSEKTYKDNKSKYTYENGDSYEGNIVDGKRTGKGKYIWACGNVYEGDFKDGKRTGKGKLTWVGGDVYEGDFLDGKVTGQGKLQWKSGEYYEGGWEDGKCSGYGKMVSASGKVSEGIFENNKFIKASKKPETIEYKNVIYYGEVKDGKPHGYGKYTWSTGEIYIGEFVDGVFNGKGKMIWPTGAVYDGSWENGKISGYGKMTYDDGSVSSGIFKDGKFVG